MIIVRNIAIVAALMFGVLLVIDDFNWQLATVAFLVAVAALILMLVGYYFGDSPFS